MSAEVLLAGLQVPEGPAVLPDGRVVFTEQTRGAVSVFDGSEHALVAVIGGAPNAVVRGSDDALYVCQNSGVVGAWRAPNRRPPGIQRIDPDGTVASLATEVDGIPLVTPNDLAFGPDGRLYFTDPAQPFDTDHRHDTGRLFALGDGAGALVRHVGAVYCNGIGFAGSGELIWVESYTRRVFAVDLAGDLVADPATPTVRLLATLPEGHVPDVPPVAADGRIFVASCGSHGIDVVGPEGSDEGFLALDGLAHPSNLCFDGSALWVTDFGVDYAKVSAAGRLWRVDTDATGLPVHTGALPVREQESRDLR